MSKINSSDMIYSRIISKIDEVKTRIENVSTSFEADWYRKDLEDYEMILSAYENDSIKELIMDNLYGEIWEKWMALKGLSEEV